MFPKSHAFGYPVTCVDEPLEDPDGITALPTFPLPDVTTPGPIRVMAAAPVRVAPPIAPLAATVPLEAVPKQ